MDLDTRHAGRVAAACSRTRATRPTSRRTYNGIDGRAAVSSAAAGRPAARRPVRRLRAVGGPARNGQAGASSRSRRWRSVDRRRVACARRRRHAAREYSKRLAERLGVARSRRAFVGPVPTTTLIELYAGALAVVYAPVRRGLRLRDARSVPRAQAGHHGARLGRPARVRRRRRQRRGLRARRRRRWPRRSTRTRPTGAARRRTAMPATRARRRSPGTASSRSWSRTCPWRKSGS